MGDQSIVATNNAGVAGCVPRYPCNGRQKANRHTIKIQAPILKALAQKRIALDEKQFLSSVVTDEINPERSGMCVPYSDEVCAHGGRTPVVLSSRHGGGCGRWWGSLPTLFAATASRFLHWRSVRARVRSLLVNLLGREGSETGLD